MAAFASHFAGASSLQCFSRDIARTTWHDLPLEVLIRIAKETVILAQSSNDVQYARPDLIPTTFGAINRSARTAFFDAVKDDCVFLRVIFHTCDRLSHDTTFLPELRKYWSSQKMETCWDDVSHSGSAPPSIILNLYECEEHLGEEIGNVVIVASDWNIILLKSVLTGLLGVKLCYYSLVVSSNITRPAFRQRILSILTDVSDISCCDFLHVQMTVYPEISSSVAIVERLCAQMMQTSNHRNQSAVHTKHLQSLRKSSRSMPDLLAVSELLTLEHFCFFRVDEILTYIDPSVAIQRCNYITLVFRGLSVILFNQPDMRERESHFMIQDTSSLSPLLSWCLSTSEQILRSTTGWDHLRDSEEGKTLIKSVVRMLQSHAEYELAAARASHIPRKAGRSHVWQSIHHRVQHRGVAGHMELASKVQNFLSKLVRSTHYEEAGMSCQKESSDHWLSGFSKVSEQIIEETRKTEPSSGRTALCELTHHVFDSLHNDSIW